MNTAPVCNHDLPLPPRTSLAEALDGYGRAGFNRKLTAQEFTARAFGLPPAWYERHQLAAAAAAGELAALIRAQARDAANEARLTLNVRQFDAALESSLEAKAERRRIEHQVAHRLREAAPLADERTARDMRDLAESMLLCRVDGHAGVDQDGECRFTWPHKCGSARLCPDEAREHAAYEARRYADAIMEHISRGPAYRAHFLVFTMPDPERGGMVRGIEDLWGRFRDFLDFKRPCKGKHRRRYGWSARKRTIPLWQPAQRDGGAYTGPGIHGALAQLECHLTAAGRWHPHLNVIVLTRGRFDYRMVRKVWGFNVECRPIRANAYELAATFRELIKYAARHVGEKSQAKADSGRSSAPPLVEWPLAALAEWYAATRQEVEGADGRPRIAGARWLRSYGVLHGIPPPNPEAPAVRWLRRVSFTDAGGYCVGFIPGSKFSDSDIIGADFGYRLPRIRPPPAPRLPPGGAPP